MNCSMFSKKCMGINCGNAVVFEINKNYVDQDAEDDIDSDFLNNSMQRLSY